jgi:hypothetical protein
MGRFSNMSMVIGGSDRAASRTANHIWSWPASSPRPASSFPWASRSPAKRWPRQVPSIGSTMKLWRSIGG